MSDVLRMGGVLVPLAVTVPSCCEEDDDVVEVLRVGCLEAVLL